MEYWRGPMDWSVKKGWKCETCGEYAGLTWGLRHGVCRCNQCHTQYAMRDFKSEGEPSLTIPCSLLKEDYKEPAKRLWNSLHKPINEATDEEWDMILATGSKEVGGSNGRQ